MAGTSPVMPTTLHAQIQTRGLLPVRPGAPPTPPIAHSGSPGLNLPSMLSGQQGDLHRYPTLFHTIAYFYVIYRYVISKWRSSRPVEINQYDITMDTHYDITMGNDIARDAHCEITMGNDVAVDIHCEVTMHNDVAMNIF